MLKKLVIPLLVVVVLAALMAPLIMRARLRRELSVQPGVQQEQAGSRTVSNNPVKPLPLRRIHTSNEPTPISPYLKWILAADFISNIWLGIRLYKLLNTGGYEKSFRWHWVTNDGKHYMDATQRQTGEWKRPTFWGILGYLVVINAFLLLMIATLCCYLISLITPNFFNDSYWLAIYSVSLLLLTVFFTKVY